MSLFDPESTLLHQPAAELRVGDIIVRRFRWHVIWTIPDTERIGFRVLAERRDGSKWGRATFTFAPGELVRFERPA